MKKFILVLSLIFAFAIAGKAFAGSIALTGTLPAGYKTNIMTTPAANNNIRMAQSINMTGQLPANITKGATAAIPAQSINLSGVLPAGVQGLSASSGNGQAVGIAALEGLGFLFTVKLLTFHF